MKYLLILSFVTITSCQTNKKYPDGGFDYPKNIIDSDTNLYSYQLKDIESRRDAFRESYNYLFYRSFDEPNLSIKPQIKETFRLTYSTAFGQSVIITFNEDELIVKKGQAGEGYDADTSKLTSTEKFHLSLLESRYPIDTTTSNTRLKKYLDSLISLYPELLDPVYYHKLYDKSFVRNDKKFQFQKFKIDITKQQYHSLVDQINSSGYWTFPYKITCDDQPNDGYSYTLEANTFKKYKTVRASSCPSDKSNFPKICQKIIELAKLDNEIKLDND